MLKRPAGAANGAALVPAMEAQAAGTPGGSSTPGTPVQPPLFQPDQLLGQCWYCQTEVRADAKGHFPGGSRSFAKLKCSTCCSAHSSLNRRGVSLKGFEGLAEEERAEFWKEVAARRTDKTQLLEFVEESRGKLQQTLEEEGHDAKLRPLAFYTSMGYSGDYIEQHYKDNPQYYCIQYGTPCYKLPLSFLKQCTRDVEERGQKTQIKPDDDGRAVLTPKSKKGELPPRGSDHHSWTAQQISAWSGHLVHIARAKVKELQEVSLKPEWEMVPPLVRTKHTEVLNRWNYVCISQKSESAWYHSHEQLDEYVEGHKTLLKMIKQAQAFLNKLMPPPGPPPAPAKAPGAPDAAPPPKAKAGAGGAAGPVGPDGKRRRLSGTLDNKAQVLKKPAAAS